MQSWSFDSFLGYLGDGYSLVGQESTLFNDFAPIDKGTVTDITFCSSEGKEGLQTILNSKSGIILCKKSLEGVLTQKADSNSHFSKLYVFVNNPRLVFIRIVKSMKGSNEVITGISRHAVIAESAKIGFDCFVGDYTIIGDGCVIGDNSIIEPRVVLKNTTVGKNCLVQPGCIVGESGFAFERLDTDKSLEGFPHFGRVIIKNNVEIFANCSVARGSISNTVIEDGTKIDALCHLAHNVHIGRDSQITAGTIIGGSAQIGNNCWLGLNSTVKHKIKIGNNVIVGSGSSVIHDVLDDEIVAGVPAKSIKQKITISEDKLFLMGGQSIMKGEGDRQVNHNLSNRKNRLRQKRFIAFIGF